MRSVSSFVRVGVLGLLAALVLAISAGSAIAAPPANDNYANATEFGTAPGQVTGSNVDATREAGEPANGNATAWWKWTAPDSGRYRLDTCQTVPSFDSFVGVYTGTNVASLTQVAVDDDSCDANNLSAVAFDAVSGTTYRFSVGNTSGTPSPNIKLSLRRTPPNDNFAAAFPIADDPAAVSGSNFEASRESGEPNNGLSTIWWSWTAPATGQYLLNTCLTTPAFDSLLGVYTGGSVNQLQTVAVDDDSCEGSNLSSLAFAATDGLTYRFSVGSNFAATSQNVILALVSQACLDAQSAIARGTLDVTAAEQKVAMAKKSVKKAKKAVKAAKSERQVKAAKKKLKAAKKKLKAAKADLAKLKADLGMAQAAQATAC